MSSWAIESRVEAGVRRHQLELRRDGRVASWREVIDGWCLDDDLADALGAAIRDTTFPACFWECAPLTRGGLDQPFACVVLDAPALDGIAPEPHVFAREWTDAASRDEVATFPNLGHDAMLVVPRPVAEPDAYAHLMAFLRGAPLEQQRALWRAIGHGLVQRVGGAPVWTSTSGLGVAWLHVRLDDRPKYYQHAPYARGAR